MFPNTVSESAVNNSDIFELILDSTLK